LPFLIHHPDDTALLGEGSELADELVAFMQAGKRACLDAGECQTHRDGTRRKREYHHGCRLQWGLRPPTWQAWMAS
tara:strand:+ start:5016 stop:5243 length:228 start_codon:yes stop_codon:yes gene_type:complete